MQVDHFSVHHTSDEVIATVSGRLITRLAELVQDGTRTTLVLSQCDMVRRVLHAISGGPQSSAVDWSNIEIYLSDDEWEAHLKDRSIAEFAKNVGATFYPLPDSSQYSAPEEGANAFAVQLGLGSSRMPAFDLALLEIGPRASVAALFPEHPALHDNRWMTAVRGIGDAKITMTTPQLSNCDEIWLVTTGSENQEAVRLTLSERAGLKQAPSAGIRGKYRTLLFTDLDAAGDLAESARIASP